MVIDRLLLAGLISIGGSALAQEVSDRNSPGAGVAQDSDTFAGSWRVSWMTGAGQQRDADLTIAGESGNWREMLGRRRQQDNPCVAHTYPVTVQRNASTELAFKVESTKVMAGCPEFAAAVKRVDANTLEGQFKNGQPVKLVRQ